MNCPNCGSFIADGAAICPSCGSIVAQQGFQQPNFQQQGYPNMGYQQPNFQQQSHPNMGYQQPNFQQQGYPNMGYQQPNFQQQSHPNMEYQQPVQPTYEVPKKKARVPLVKRIINTILFVGLFVAWICVLIWLKNISNTNLSGTYDLYSVEADGISYDEDEFKAHGVFGSITFNERGDECSIQLNIDDLEYIPCEVSRDGDEITFTTKNHTKYVGTYDKDDETITITYENGTIMTFKK